jgi:hypothetical protein
MPRIYAPNEDHTMAWGAIDFFNGVSAVPAGINVAWFTANGYTIDNSKHVTTLLDDLTAAKLRLLCAYLGITIDAGEDPDSKHTLVRAIEGSISTKYFGSVTVSSAAGTEVGDSAITITGEGAYKYKTAATTAPAPLFRDNVADWDDIETGDNITPAEGHDKIAVALVDANGYVLALGSDDITVKTE